MAFDLLAALGFIHSKGVIHRDLKPANVMLTTVDGRLACKLIDFSIAAVAQESREEVSATLQTGTTSLAALAGTPHYMSPEQIREGVVVTAQIGLGRIVTALYYRSSTLYHIH